jgi:hypothetical protein
VGFCEDLGESIGELVEAMLGSAVRQRTAEHLDGVLGEQQRIDDAGQTAARRRIRGFWLRRKMPGLRSGEMKFPLQIGSGDIDVTHRHLGIDVAEQLHERRQAYPCAHQLAAIEVSYKRRCQIGVPWLRFGQRLITVTARLLIIRFFETLAVETAS